MLLMCCQSGLLYGLFEGLPVIFEDIHGFSLGLAALPFIGVLIGTTLGAGLNVLLTLKYRELQVLWKGAVPPEERLTGAIIAGWLLAIGCFWLGWTGYRADIHWAAPAVALVPIGMSFTLIFISLLSSITDTYLMYSASALAGNTIFRSAVRAETRATAPPAVQLTLSFVAVRCGLPSVYPSILHQSWP